MTGAGGERLEAPVLSPVLLLATVTLIAGLTPIGARLAATEAPPLLLALFRFGTAGALLYLTLRLAGRRWRFERSELWSLLGVAALCVPANQIGFLWGVRLASASHGGVAYALTPVLVFWISLALGQERFAGRLALATVLAFAGAGMVALARADLASSVGRRFLAGDLLLLTAVFTWSLFSVLSKPLVRRHGALEVLSAVFLLGSLLHLPLLAVDHALLDLSTFRPGALSARAWAGFAFITLVTSYLNYLLWYLIIQRASVTRSSVVTNASFLVTVLVEWAWLGEPLGAWVAGGSALTLASVVLAGKPGPASR